MEPEHWPRGGASLSPEKNILQKVHCDDRDPYPSFLASQLCHGSVPSAFCTLSHCRRGSGGSNSNGDGSGCVSSMEILQVRETNVTEVEAFAEGHEA